MTLTLSEASAGFDALFAHATGGYQPHPYQRQLALAGRTRTQLIRVPTGLGKTAGAVLGWLWRRRFADETIRRQTPRRLVYCLPMRVLVEQTFTEAVRWLERLGLLAGQAVWNTGDPDGLPEPSSPLREYQPDPADARPVGWASGHGDRGQGRVAVHLLMGGEERTCWELWPQQDAVLIGTQDMLLSRALNRGYASPRARWPMEFGLLHQDALWVLDEVQLMEVGLATSAQLQAFRDQDSSRHLRPCYTWWMSATLQPDWLRSVDTAEHYPVWIENPCEISPPQQAGGVWSISKQVTTARIAVKQDKEFARLIVDEHAQLDGGAFGKITLVVCNTVERACRTFEAVQQLFRGEVRLVHSRFRPAEREQWLDFLSRSACTPGAERILVATQVVEAGVDLSAGCLITELAPWPSLVQRYGRCARYGGSGRVLVVDRRKNPDDAAPYRPEELASAWEAVQRLTDVGIAALEHFERSLDEQGRRRLYPYAPQHLLLRHELEDLFDTTPDLTGADLDISRFIRCDEERDLHMFWRDIPADQKGQPPHQPSDDQPHRRELCAVPFLKARDWLCEKGKSKLKSGMRAWIWDWLDGAWKPVTREALLPGRVVCVASDCGGYRPDRGFDPDATKPVPPVAEPNALKDWSALALADEQQDAELPGETWQTIAWHTCQVAGQTRTLAEALELPDELQELLELAARWHDWGKVHPAFQGSIRGSNGTPRPSRMDLAKAPSSCWPKAVKYQYLDGSDARPGFRHELASALGLFALLRMYAPRHEALLGPWADALAQLGQPVPVSDAAPQPTPLVERLLNCPAEAFDLVAYLVASHHGKVRVGLHASPKDQDYRDRDGRGLPIRGVREGDVLPSVALAPGEAPLPEVTLSLSPANVGLSPHTGISWQERCIRLQRRYSPAALAFLEAILRAADARASQQASEDPALAGEDHP